MVEYFVCTLQLLHNRTSQCIKHEDVPVKKGVGYIAYQPLVYLSVPLLQDVQEKVVVLAFFIETMLVKL